MGNYNPGGSKTSQQQQQHHHHHHHHVTSATNRAASKVSRSGANRLFNYKCSSTNLGCQHKHEHLHNGHNHHSKSNCRGNHIHRSHQRHWTEHDSSLARDIINNDSVIINNIIDQPSQQNMTTTNQQQNDQTNSNIGTISRRTSKQNHSQIPLTKSKLPAGYTKRQTSQGQVFFVDSHGQKFWYDPSVPRDLLNASLNLDELVGKLSLTWEIKQAPSGKIYYVNHVKKTTQFTDPRLVAYREYLMSILSTNTNIKSSRTTTTPSHSNSHNNNRSLYTSPNAPVAQQSQPKSPATISDSQQQDHASSPYGNLGPPLYRPAESANYSSQSLEHNHQSQPQLLNRSSTIASHNNQTTYDSQALYGYGSSPNNSAFGGTLNRNDLIGRQQSITATSAITNINVDSKLLSDKIGILRQELVKRQCVSQTCKIDIRRRKIFEESFRIISQMSSRDLKKRLNVRFKGEEGVDFGGVAREWFYLLSREMLNPVHGLFQYTSSDIYNLQINPDSGIVYSEHLSYMHFCGRIIGMAVFHGHFTEGHFTLPFYKMLLRKPITLDDIEFVDPELHRGLCWMLENDITDALDTTFLVEHNAFGQIQEHELKENGKEIAVTEKNKREYVSLYVNYRCRRGIEKQYEALQRGFDELIEPSLLQSFNEHELELLIGGLSKINVDDWRANTKLKNCTVETALVKWFWDILKTHFNEDKRAQLLQFVTGSPRVPIQGFRALRGVEAELRPFTIHLIRNGNTNDLPKSHTCFNRLDLPPYETYDKLRDKLTQAIEETMGFALQ